MIDRENDFRFHCAYLAYSKSWDENDATEAREKLNELIESLSNEKISYPLEAVEANEVNEDFVMQASSLFYAKNQRIQIHKANWLDLPQASPPYKRLFDFGFLTGNSLTYIGGGSREYTKRALQSILSKFAKLIKKGSEE